LAEHWDLPNTGIFYSKDVASDGKEIENDFKLIPTQNQSLKRML
jgi:hypothetical protein